MTKFTKTLLLSLAVFAVGVFLGSADALASAPRQTTGLTLEICQTVVYNMSHIIAGPWTGDAKAQVLLACLGDLSGAEMTQRYCAAEATTCNTMLGCFPNVDFQCVAPTLDQCQTAVKTVSDLTFFREGQLWTEVNRQDMLDLCLHASDLGLENHMHCQAEATTCSDLAECAGGLEPLCR